MGTVVALGLNYADHVKELSKELTVTSKDEPQVFMKGPGTLVGHNAQTRRPRDATFMHYERTGSSHRQAGQRREVSEAMAYVAATRYATTVRSATTWRTGIARILRVKNRDTCTVL